MMKGINAKQVVLYLVGILVCRVSWMGCYPLIPAYFTAGCLMDCPHGLLCLAMLAGIVAFVPITAAVKYLVALFVIFLTVKLFVWVEEKCTVICAAAAAAIAVLLMSLTGILLGVRLSVNWLTSILEAAFVFAATILGTRVMDVFLQMDFHDAPNQPVGQYYAQKLENYADSFSGLSKVFSKMNSAQKELSSVQMGRIQNELTSSLCVNCNQCALCWEKAESPMSSYFAYMLQSLQRIGEPDHEIVVQMQEYCPYTDAVIQEAIQIFEKARLNLAWYNRLLENREIIAQQLDAMAYIMEDCAGQIQDITNRKRSYLAEVRFRAKERGLIIKNPHLYEDKEKRWEFTCDVYAKSSGSVSTKELIRAVSAGLQRDMCPYRNERSLIGPQGTSVVFVEDTCFHETHAVARRIKDGGTVSGDNYSFLKMDGGQMAVMLSDGMGSGDTACKESGLVLELLEKFLEAGFAKETALQMMNSAMVIRGEDDLYSTVDICSVDLYTGVCELYKVGAAATFIKHPDYVECIESSSLPVGAACHLEIKKTTKQLEDGDFLVMVTDGVLEYLQTKDPQADMCELLQMIGFQHPGQMADAILDAVLDQTGGARQDDMTVLVCGIWRK